MSVKHEAFAVAYGVIMYLTLLKASTQGGCLHDEKWKPGFKIRGDP